MGQVKVLFTLTLTNFQHRSYTNERRKGRIGLMLILRIFIVGLSSGIGGSEGLFGCWCAMIEGVV